MLKVYNPSKKYECFLSRWGGQSDSVFTQLEGDFMKPRISEVRRLALKKLRGSKFPSVIDFIYFLTTGSVSKLKLKVSFFNYI